MAFQTETARQWHGERLPKRDLLGGVIASEGIAQALQLQRLVTRFGLEPAVAAVIAAHLFGRAAG